MQTIRIGIAGLGVVGSGVVKHLWANADLIAERTGFRIEVARVAERDPARCSALGIDSSRLTVDPLELARDPSLKIVVELMGGTGIARQFIDLALRQGKGVVTANKALLAEAAEPLVGLATQNRLPLCFEASVAGGIPILKALREGLVANRIISIHGIVNGTCNFILSSMTQSGQPYAEALAEAQRQGFAEADPTLDVGGFDAMHKACILAALAYGFWIRPSDVHTRGIDAVTPEDLHFAKVLGYTIKHLAVVRCDEDGAVEVHVGPTLIPSTNVMASVGGVFNALAVRGDVVGDTLFYGRGAGPDATASAVISDIAEASSALAQGYHLPACGIHGLYNRFRPYGETRSRYYVRFSVADRPGVLAQIADVFGKHQISIASVFQPKEHPGAVVPLVMLLYRAREQYLRDALAEISRLPVNQGESVALRVEDFDT
ncbi:MAG TPA: homoserine dehydrogenase [Verrucomicrobiae bacterium]|nr:homoserine dehydrogenase [Verrucomicrobiae bacterium]